MHINMQNIHAVLTEFLKRWYTIYIVRRAEAVPDPLPGYVVHTSADQGTRTTDN